MTMSRKHNFMPKSFFAVGFKSIDLGRILFGCVGSNFVLSFSRTSQSLLNMYVNISSLLGEAMKICVFL